MATVIIFANTQYDHKNYFTNSLLSDCCVLGTVLSTADELVKQTAFVNKNEALAHMEVTSQ